MVVFFFVKLVMGLSWGCHRVVMGLSWGCHGVAMGLELVEPEQLEPWIAFAKSAPLSCFVEQHKSLP